MPLIDRLAASPCCLPDMPLDDMLAAYARIGFRKFEVFTSFAAPFDINADPETYLAKGGRHGIAFTSLHLPSVGQDLDVTRAVAAARFARALGAGIVLFKAASRKAYIRAAGPFLDAVDGLGLTPVLQNHFGTPITSLEDFRMVLSDIDDPRMRALLEVGHFHSAGVGWREACDRLGDRIALVHVKDQVGQQSVPFATGEIDLPGLFEHLRSLGYRGDFVVEMEVEDRENTLTYLADAVRHLEEHCGGADD
jgi:sugar phosphate isomerase/epimerase